MSRAEPLELLDYDADRREEHVRAIVAERLNEHPPPVTDDFLVASYFFVLRTRTVSEVAAEIAYHATSGIKQPPPGSLLEACTGKALAVDEFDASGRVGLLHMGFPLKMLLHRDGHATSTDILHTVGAAIVFDVYEHQDAKLVRLGIPSAVLKTFPGPAYGPGGIRSLADFPADRPAFGTILKPTAGLTADDVERLVADVAECPLFLFVKEDEDFYPDLEYAPLTERTRRAVAAIEAARDGRAGVGLVFAPHVTAAPHEIVGFVEQAVAAGASGVMFSESFAGGTVRMVREATRSLERPPAIYGHNAGIGVRTRSIWREVIDFLARLDGIDFRQTAPVANGTPFLRPYGAEWVASEEALTRPVDGIAPTMITRAGGLDQGNIILNLEDAEDGGKSDKILFLAGSAINSITNRDGVADPRIGAEAMTQALDVHRSRELRGVPRSEHLRELVALAERRGLQSLREALRQRYPGEAS
jgi:ribulose 1,5-bisphosphate carboxylase large subunit-like protein